ncbi:endonuclease domain-containing protein [Candidatus Falkowbacteria bacterium]|nr:endonuclease domain-containing protein [Candidatus Falkowbacteria bacterium]
MQNQVIKRRNLHYNPKLKVRARELRNNMTAAENKLWFEYLRQISFKVYRQKPIRNFIVDFYIPQFKLVIEVDGETHMRDAEYDDNRTEELKKLGLRIIRFWNNDILEGFAGVCDRIESYLNKA